LSSFDKVDQVEFNFVDSVYRALVPLFCTSIALFVCKHDDAQIHFVHFNKKYKNIDAALEHKDGIAVLGIFAQVRLNFNVDLCPVGNQ